MPRIPNTRPTSIYWLFDMRPETLVEWSQGRPFYCGKTVKSPHDRLKKHQATARECPHRKISNWLNACGTHMRVQTMEVVSPNNDWAPRERHWIATLRLLFQGAQMSSMAVKVRRVMFEARQHWRNLAHQ